MIGRRQRLSSGAGPPPTAGASFCLTFDKRALVAARSMTADIGRSASTLIALILRDASAFPFPQSLLALQYHFLAARRTSFWR